MRSSASPHSEAGGQGPFFEPDPTHRGDPLAIVLRTADHSYWTGDERVIGVSETLHTLDLIDLRFYTDEGRDRGHRVHQRTSALDRQQTPAPPVLAEELGFCESWTRYCALWVPTFLLIERALWCPRRRLAGTVDRVALLRRPGIPKHIGIIDGKTGAEEDTHCYQLSLYDIVVSAWLQVYGGPLAQLPRARYGVYLRADGRAPKVRAFPFEPVVHALVAAAQLKLALGVRR